MAPTVPTKKTPRANSLPRTASTQRDPYPKPASTKATKDVPVDMAFAGNQHPFETKQDTSASQDAEVNLPTPDVLEHTDASQPPAWLIEFQNQIRAHDARLTQIESRELEIVALREQLNETNSALTEAHSLIAQLRAQLHANQLSDNRAAFIPEMDSTMEDKADFPTLKQPSRDTHAAVSQHAVDDFDASKIEPDLSAAYAKRRVSFATVAKKATSSSGKHQRRLPTRSQKQFVALSFTPPSESQGFQYVYLPCRKKESRRVMREKFHKLGTH
ncbi:hypothetical protein G6F33_013040 [Rhizopus arrhizus]|nr:hypothetical protein G6F33_013040 [Rhizopus arrhizus]